MRNTLLVAAGFLIATAASGQMLYEFDPDIDIESGISVSSSASSIGPKIVMPGEFRVGIDFDLVRSGPGLLGFPLPDGETIWIVRSRFEDRGNGNVSWTGRETASEYNSVRLMLEDGRLLGNFTAGEDEWQIVGSKLRKIVRGDVPPEMFPAPRIPPVPAVQHPSDDAGPVSVVAASTNGKYTQDVLVLYTEEARQYVEDRWYNNYWYWTGSGWIGPGWRVAIYDGYKIADLINYANQVANEAYDNGEIPIHSRVVGIERMPASADPGPGYTYGEKTLDTQTYDDEVKRLRVQYNADIVYSYIFDTTRPCGIAWTRTKENARTDHHFVGLAHANTNLYCDAPGSYKQDKTGNNIRWVTPYYETTVHEIGHIHGALHGYVESNIKEDLALFPHGYAYKNSGIGKKTIMANGGLQHINYFSTTRITPNGWVIGEANRAENERVMQAMAYRTSVLSDFLVPPLAPSDLSATVSKVSGKWRVSLYWTDNAWNETKYEVKYGRTKKNKQVRADPFDHTQTYKYDEFPNMTTALLLDLEHRKEYAFKVIAVNENSLTSAESETITLKIKSRSEDL